VVRRYYFHTENGQSQRDRDGVDLPGLDAARHEAVRALCDILKERSGQFWAEGVFRMIVADDDGLTLFMVEVTAVSAPAVSGT
jgi:hypothetical protein